MKAFLFYVDDWLASKRIQQMDADEERGYLRLLLNEATEQDCGLPDDDDHLAILSLLGKQWNRPTKDRTKRIGNMTSGAKLRACFTVREGRLFQERLYREFQYQKKAHLRRADAGKQGGRPVNGESNAFEIQKLSKSKPKANHKQHSLGLGLGFEVSEENQKTVEMKEATEIGAEISENQQEQWFTEFWEAYWLHVAKKKARESFQSRVSSEKLFQKVLRAVRKQSPSMLKREPDKRPHASTWLNQERWEDEVAGYDSGERPKPAPVKCKVCGDTGHVLPEQRPGESNTEWLNRIEGKSTLCPCKGESV